MNWSLNKGGRMRRMNLFTGAVALSWGLGFISHTVAQAEEHKGQAVVQEATKKDATWVKEHPGVQAEAAHDRQWMKEHPGVREHAGEPLTKQDAQWLKEHPGFRKDVKEDRAWLK